MTDPPRKGLRSAADWARVRERIEKLGRTLAGDARQSPERTTAVLEARAQALATPPPSRDKADALELVVFDLAAEAYAIESRYVVEVLRRAEVALLPGVEPPLLGIAAWRGELLTLLDARHILGLPAAPLADDVPILVLGDEQPAFGIVVDGVRELREVSTAALRPLTGRPAPGGAHPTGITEDAVLVLAAAELIRTHT